MLVIASWGRSLCPPGRWWRLMAQINMIIWDGVMTSVRSAWYIFVGLGFWLLSWWT